MSHSCGLLQIYAVLSFFFKFFFLVFNSFYKGITLGLSVCLHGSCTYICLSIDIMCYPFLKQALAFTCLYYRSFGNTVGKGAIARNEKFLLFPLCFLPV